MKKIALRRGVHSWRPQSMNTDSLSANSLFILHILWLCKKIKKNLSCHQTCWDTISNCFWKVIFKLYPRGRGCANLLFGKLVAENCMKMKEFGSNWKLLFLFQTFKTLFLFLQYLTCICFPSISVIPNAFFSSLCMTSLICLSALQVLKDLAEKNVSILLVFHQFNEKNCTCKKYMQRAIVRNWQNKQCSRFSIFRYKIDFFVLETFCLPSVTSLYRYNLLSVQ